MLILHIFSWDVLWCLLGANIDAEDNFGETALSTATYFDHKDSERHLFLFRWQQRAKESKPRMQHEMFAHQYYDSAFPVWLTGDRAQLYFMQILPASEFEGTSFSAPRKQEKVHKYRSESLQENGTSYGEPVAGRRRGSRTAEVNFTSEYLIKLLLIIHNKVSEIFYSYCTFC